MPKESFKNLPHTLPSIDVIFSAYNEETVIEEKIHSVFNTNYPKHLLSMSIATDNPDDQTVAIIEKLQKQYPQLHHYPSSIRVGKAQNINKLAALSQAEILVPTDANILFMPHTLIELVNGLEQEDVGIAGATIHYKDVKNEGIAPQEDFYLQRENKMKIAQGRLHGATMGVEGACYAIRRKDFKSIPEKFFMEDFFQTLQILEQGKKSILCESAQVWEDISTQASQEFKRKVRISIGNFQNMNRFASILFKKPIIRAYYFLSHKILRWITPHALIVLLLIAVLQSFRGVFFYQLMLSLAAFSVFMAFLGAFWKSTSRWAKMCIFVHHFYHMNIALAYGFIKYIKGVETNVWQPTKRNQAKA